MPARTAEYFGAAMTAAFVIATPAGSGNRDLHRSGQFGLSLAQMTNSTAGGCSTRVKIRRGM
jgi:hypothetical protein